MADSGTGSVLYNQLISSTQAQKEVNANELFNGMSNSSLYGRRLDTTALTWKYYGGRVQRDGTYTTIPNNEILLTASTTNYISVNPATGVVSKNSTAFTPGEVPLYSVVTGASTITSYTDYRVWSNYQLSGNWSTFTMSDADYTLNAQQCLSTIVTISGTLTATRAIIYPGGGIRVGPVMIRNVTNYPLTIKNNPAGSTVTIPAGASNILYTGGGNIFSFNSLAEDTYLAEGVDLILGTSTGSKIGTSTTQKLGFWNATPSTQPASANQAVVSLGNTDNEIGGLTISAAYDQAEMQALRDKTEELADDVRALSTLIHQLRSDLVTIGLIKGSA